MLLNLTGTPTLEPAVPLSPDPAPIREFDVGAEYPHDPRALTQSLIYISGFFYESIGRQPQLPVLHYPAVTAVNASASAPARASVKQRSSSATLHACATQPPGRCGASPSKTSGI